MVSVSPAVADFHEFKMFKTKDANGTIVPIEIKAGLFESINGVTKVTTASGLRINIAPDYIKTHKVIKE